MANARKRGSRAVRRPAGSTASLGETSIAQSQDAIGRNALLLQDFYRAEHRAMAAERELAEFRAKLVRLLSQDQLDAAKVCGVTPEFYAMECIELYKEKFFPYLAPAMRPLFPAAESGMPIQSYPVRSR